MMMQFCAKMTYVLFILCVSAVACCETTTTAMRSLTSCYYTFVSLAYRHHVTIEASVLASRRQRRRSSADGGHSDAAAAATAAATAAHSAASRGAPSVRTCVDDRSERSADHRRKRADIVVMAG